MNVSVIWIMRYSRVKLTYNNERRDVQLLLLLPLLPTLIDFNPNKDNLLLPV